MLIANSRTTSVESFSPLLLYNVYSVNQSTRTLQPKDQSSLRFDNVIGDPSRRSPLGLIIDEAYSVISIAFLFFVEPNSYNEALTESCWIEAMQEELNEFERIKVYEMVPRLDRVIYKALYGKCDSIDTQWLLNLT
ncbi:hypothetical protein Tco_1506034 [Tanacetum coccineum]